MFFSVIKYYTKTNKKITLKQSESKNSVKKTKIKKPSMFSACPVEKNDRTVVALCENKKMKIKNPLRSLRLCGEKEMIKKPPRSLRLCGED